MKPFSLFILALLLLSQTACQKVFLGDPLENTILANYDQFANDFRERYGLFAVKNMEWAPLVQQYRLPLEANPTEAALYEALTGLIQELNDSHVYLYTFNQDLPFYDGGISGDLDRQGYVDFDAEIVLDQYLTLIDSVSDIIYYGTLEGNIGYLYLPQIYDVPRFFADYLPQVMADLRDTKGLVLDIRDNNGGEDESSRLIASYFADQRHLYMQSRYKIGPGPEEFEPVREWYVEPTTDEQYLKPIALLTNRYSISAAESFSFAMKSFPQVIHVGDTTTGAFSDVIARQLQNGWQYGISVGDYRDGQNISHEGIGLAPDQRVVNTPADLAAGTDRMLEAAMDALR